MKAIIEKAGKTRGYVSPSLSSDSRVTNQALSLSSFDWKTPAALFAGAWLFKKFPKTTIAGLLATGIYYGLTMNSKPKNPFQGTGIADDLH